MTNTSTTSSRRSADGLLTNIIERIKRLESRKTVIPVPFPAAFDGAYGVEVTDWNAANQIGHYWALSTAANAPDTSFAYMGRVDAADPNNVERINQIIRRIDNPMTDVGQEMGRYFNGTSWSAWKPTQGMVGEVKMWAGTSAPAGWITAQGQTLSRTSYPVLFGILGTTYGNGDGSGTTFSLPNTSGRAMVGYDSTQAEFNAVAKTGGEKTHTLSNAEMPSHNHTTEEHESSEESAGWGLYNGSGNGFNGRPMVSGVTGSATGVTWNQGGSAAHNNLQPYLVMNYIIKLG